MPAPANQRGQMLLAEEYFASENALFTETLRGVSQPKALAALADRWKKDPRPWARQQILAYLALPLNCPGHQPVVKRLFKHAEAAGDDELMAAFLVAFDRQVRRELRSRSRWDSQSRSSHQEETLVTPRDVLSAKETFSAVNPATGERMTVPVRTPRNGKLFKYRTRYYLRRRAWRYFRRLGHRRPEAYVPAIARALVAYADADLQRGENMLDSWGLMHACFGEHDAVEFGATHIKLKDGRGLGELSAAPRFLEAWKKPETAPILFSLVWQGRSRLVRTWAMQLFQREHAGYPVSVDDLLRLLDHDDAEVQQFGAKLLESSAGLGALPVAAWLRLLMAHNEEALQRICDAFGKNVAADRLSFAECLELACAQPAPVARLGQSILQARAIATPAERESLRVLADARCAAVAGELASWALGILGRSEHYSADQVIRFFDSLRVEVRAAAWSWLVADSPGMDDAMLWSRLVETPYDDLRLKVVDYLERRVKLPGTEAERLQSVWRSVLLGVHRGGRQKAKAVRQIAQAIVEDPARGETLLPVLAVAVRSVRGPEARAGLAAVVSAVEARPQLVEAVRRHLPELKFA